MVGNEGLHQFLGVGEPIDEFSVFGPEGCGEGFVEVLAFRVDVDHFVFVFAGDHNL
jgi:hypothetical protein